MFPKSQFLRLLALLTIFIFPISGCSSVPMDHRVQVVFEDEFCGSTKAELRGIDVAIKEVGGPWGQYSSRHNDISLDFKLFNREEEFVRRVIVHEYLHAVFDKELINIEQFMIDWRRYRQEPKWSTGSDWAWHEGFHYEFHMLGPGPPIVIPLAPTDTELYAVVGEQVVSGWNMPEYLLRHYRGILRRASKASV